VTLKVICGVALVSEWNDIVNDDVFADDILCVDNNQFSLYW